MSQYLLDTDTLSYLADNNSKHNPEVARHVFRTGAENLAVSILTLYELKNGLHRATTESVQTHFSEIISLLKKTISIYPLTEEGADIYGQIKTRYQAETGISNKAVKGHDVDFVLAGSAIVEGLVLVSNDKIFTAIGEFYPDLILENWTLEVPND